mgnify:CR=1 FL=1|tara:strand:+ start:66 stop:806 length:741 start_codon:yes stop_codon:yes gene_type:complete
MSDAYDNGNQNGQPVGNAGQDGSGQQQENSSNTDWEQSAKYFQSEKDKLQAENQQLGKYKKLGQLLESRPDVVQAIKQKLTGAATDNGQGQPNEPVNLTADEFDPWEAFNDPSSKSYKLREQKTQKEVNQLVGKQMQGVQRQLGMEKLKGQLAARGMSPQEQESFIKFADANPASYGLDNVIKMWRSVASGEQNPQVSNPNPLDKVRQTQGTPPMGGVLGGEQPKNVSDDDKMWQGILGIGTNKLP